MTWFFLFFFLSGLCSVLYELVWLRLAMAQFGVTTAFVSIVLSAFMAGLGVGSWGSGVWIRKYGDRVRFPALRFYALSELLIGLSALCVPMELVWGNRLLERLSDTAPISSGSYYVASGLWLVLTLVPWCALMGATVPLGMFAIRRDSRYESRRPFSYLYLANVTGAVAGTIAPLILGTLWVSCGATRRRGSERDHRSLCFRIDARAARASDEAAYC
jgi:spermidine synthase